MIKPVLAGIARAVPVHHITQEEAADFCQQLGCETDEQRLFLQEVYRSAGIRTRHSVLLERAHGSTSERQGFYSPAVGTADFGPTTQARMQQYVASAGPLAAKVAGQALHRAEVPAAAITHLVTVSCTGFAAPGFDIELIQQLELPRAIARTHIGFMGCHGALNGLRVAEAYVKSSPNATVLLTALELCTLHQQYELTPEKIVSNALFADGAAALVLGHETPALETSALNGHARCWRLAATGSYLFPNSLNDMAWYIGNHGFQMRLSRRVPVLIERKLRTWLEAWLQEQQLTLSDVKSWAIHPGGPRILDACAAALELGDQELNVSREVLAEFGNMSSPTVLFILDRLRESGTKLPCVALAFGPGLAVEAVLFTD